MPANGWKEDTNVDDKTREKEDKSELKEDRKETGNFRDLVPQETTPSKMPYATTFAWCDKCNREVLSKPLFDEHAKGGSDETEDEGGQPERVHPL